MSEDFDATQKAVRARYSALTKAMEEARGLNLLLALAQTAFIIAFWFLIHRWDIASRIEATAALALAGMVSARVFGNVLARRRMKQIDRDFPSPFGTSG